MPLELPSCIWLEQLKVPVACNLSFSAYPWGEVSMHYKLSSTFLSSFDMDLNNAVLFSLVLLQYGFYLAIWLLTYWDHEPLWSQVILACLGVEEFLVWRHSSHMPSFCCNQDINVILFFDQQELLQLYIIGRSPRVDMCYFDWDFLLIISFILFYY